MEEDRQFRDLHIYRKPCHFCIKVRLISFRNRLIFVYNLFQLGYKWNIKYFWRLMHSPILEFHNSRRQLDRLKRRLRIKQLYIILQCKYSFDHWLTNTLIYLHQLLFRIYVQYIFLIHILYKFRLRLILLNRIIHGNVHKK